MKWTMLAVALAGGACRGEVRPPAPHVDGGAADFADAPPRAELDDGTVKLRSRAFLEAYDRNDDAAFSAELARSFVLFEARRIYDRDFLTRRMGKRRGRGARPDDGAGPQRRVPGVEGMDHDGRRSLRRGRAHRA